MKPGPSIIKTGFCVAYDWRLLANSLPPVYADSDIICLAIDKERKSWSGNPFEFNETEFRAMINAIDKDGKIIIYEDNFSDSRLNARENCNLQRTLIAERLGKGGWHVQVDSDEYFIDFGGFTKFLLRLNPNPTGLEKPFNVHVFLYDLFKKVEGGYLVAYPKNTRPFSAPFATTKPEYLRARHNGHFNRISPYYVIHETWARGEKELRFKLSNWGHAAEELGKPEIRESIINLWKAIDAHNYQYLTDFHFVGRHVWEKLGFIKGDSMEDCLRNFSPRFRINPLYLKLMNNRNYGRLRFWFDKLTKA